MPHILCPKSFVLWLVHRFAMADSGMPQATSSVARNKHYNS